MQKLEAFIRTNNLDSVKQACKAEGLLGVTVMELRSGGDDPRHARYRGTEYDIDCPSRVKVELFLPDEQVTRAIGAIRSAMTNGAADDGDIFITPVVGRARIGAGEQGNGVV